MHDFRIASVRRSGVCATAWEHCSARLWVSQIPAGEDNVSSIAMRTALGIVPAAALGLAMTLQGYCQIGDILTGQATSQPGSGEQNIKSVDAFINSHFEHFTDGKYVARNVSLRVPVLLCFSEFARTTGSLTRREKRQSSYTEDSALLNVTTG
jgi:hypothetical protein